MIVIDASSLVKYVLHEEGWREVKDILEKFKPLYSIDHLAKEALNALWKHSFLHKAIDPTTVLEFYQKLNKLFETGVIVLESEGTYLGQALRIALENGVTIYDALYIAQSLRYGELLTSDEKQGKVASKLGVKVYIV